MEKTPDSTKLPLKRRNFARVLVHMTSLFWDSYCSIVWLVISTKKLFFDWDLEAWSEVSGTGRDTSRLSTLFKLDTINRPVVTKCRTTKCTSNRLFRKPARLGLKAAAFICGLFNKKCSRKHFKESSFFTVCIIGFSGVKSCNWKILMKPKYQPV